MPSIVLAHEVDWQGWRDAARILALQDIPPEQVTWSVHTPDDLFAAEAPDPAPAPAPAGAFTVPRALVALAETVIQARDPARFALLYALLWRAHRGERHIMELITDPTLMRAQRLAQSIRRDTHKMRAFLRFRELQDRGTLRHIAWFEPEHYIVEANAGFFQRRFAAMTWSILTPYRTVHWNGDHLVFAPGGRKSDLPDDDNLATYWRTYFSAIFNPARLKPAAMRAEMPKKYWRNLPEAAAIPELIRNAPARVAEMIASAPTPDRPARKPRAAVAAGKNTPLAALAAAAETCQRCPLWQPATQTVFGEGPPTARLMLVGEQPGDQEDLAGRPFVGPAGQLLDRALAEAGIDRSRVYVTNAVKHFKFTPRGKRRIHESPNTSEIAACRFWLDQEREALNPQLTILMGASAARAVLGRPVAIGRTRGAPIRHGDSTVFVTVHPSYLLRLPDEDAKRREYAAFVGDLAKAAALVG